MTHYISRARLRSGIHVVAKLFENMKKPTGGADFSHRLSWSLFERPDDTRNFLFRELGASDDWDILMVSPDAPKDRQDIWEVETKELAMPAEGSHVKVDLRLNLVGPRKGGSGSNLAHVVAKEFPDKTLLECAQIGVRRWFGRFNETDKEGQLVYRGFDIEPQSIAVDRIQSERIGKAAHSRARIAMCDLSFVASVVDPQRAFEAMTGGIGRARAYGCGMPIVTRYNA